MKKIIIVMASTMLVLASMTIATQVHAQPQLCSSTTINHSETSHISQIIFL